MPILVAATRRTAPVLVLLTALAALIAMVTLVLPAAADPVEQLEAVIDPRVGVADGETPVEVRVVVTRDGEPAAGIQVHLDGVEGTIRHGDTTTSGQGALDSDAEGRGRFLATSSVTGVQRWQLSWQDGPAATLEVRFEAPDRGETGRFSDVPADHTFSDQIAWLADQGITLGRDDGTFDINDPVTRGAMAAFLFRYADSGLPRPDGEPVPDGDQAG